MVEIYLCRHGQSVANAEGTLAGHFDSPLNDIGREQAHGLARLAKNTGLCFNHVYSSPLSRARETAKIIAKATGSPEPEVIDGLKERDFGVLTGKPYADIGKYSKDILQTDDVFYFLDGEGVESFPDALERAKKVLQGVKGRHKSGKVLLVTHGDLGMMLFAAFHKIPWRDALTRFDFGNSELLLLKVGMDQKPHVFEIDQRDTKEVA